MTQLINDTFDVLNGRFCKEGITVENWGLKKAILDTMLTALDITETVYEKDKKVHMFCSQTTLHGLRTSIKSVIEITERQLNAGYSVVLTGKLNQDPIEVFKYFIQLERPLKCSTFVIRGYLVS